MELLQGQFTGPGPVAILPGSFHPPTVAHLALATAALSRASAVVFTLPRAFPHKSYEGVGLPGRLAMLHRLTVVEPRFLVALSDGGLFVEMAREWRALQPGAGKPYVICGRDAAERIVHWDYSATEPFHVQLADFTLLAAARQGAFSVPPHLRGAIEPLDIAPGLDDISSTRVRAAIAAGQDWRPLVPPVLWPDVERLYID